MKLPLSPAGTRNSAGVLLFNFSMKPKFAASKMFQFQYNPGGTGKKL